MKILWADYDCKEGNLTVDNYKQELPRIGQHIDITDKDYNLILLTVIGVADITGNTLNVKVRRKQEYNDKASTPWFGFVLLFMLGFICRGII